MSFKNLIDLTGNLYDTLKVEHRAPKNGQHRHPYWVCVCQACGKKLTIRGSNLPKTTCPCQHQRPDLQLDLFKQ